MKTPIEKLRNYRKLRRAYYGRAIVPQKNTQEMEITRASIHSLDMTEDYLLFQAMLEEEPMPIMENYVMKTLKARTLARVNQHLFSMLKAYRKPPVTFTGLLKHLVA